MRYVALGDSYAAGVGGAAKLGEMLREVQQLVFAEYPDGVRTTDAGAELAGQNMAGGDPVFLLLGAANRDAAEFEDPDSFDMHRTNKAHLGFGFGFHHCLGVNIARQEARAFVSVLLDTFPQLRVAEIDYGQSWALWGPRALHVALPDRD